MTPLLRSIVFLGLVLLVWALARVVLVHEIQATFLIGEERASSAVGLGVSVYCTLTVMRGLLGLLSEKKEDEKP